MRSRNALAILALFCTALSGLLHSSIAAAADPPPRRPNIVLLISDDDDYENFGFMGNKRVHTPTLDALARSGTLFTTAYNPAPLCRPSLAGLLSGRLPQQTGITSNYLDMSGIGNDRTKLDPRDSLPNRLKEAGYASYATAKYWEGDPRKMGFTDGTVSVSMNGFGKFVRQGQDELFHFVDANHGKRPMFIWWAPLVPHEPHTPPPRLAKQFENTPVEIPAYFKGDPKKYVNATRKFYAMETLFDEGVAALIKKLKETGEFDNTLFLFYVDNGWTIGHLAKNSPYEKGVHTPMIVSWPGHVPAGKRIDGLSYAIDLHATALDFAGLTPPADIASKSLRPLLEGKTDKTHDALFGATFAHAPAVYKGTLPRGPGRDVFSIYSRTPRWKYILYTQDINRENDKYIWVILVQCPPLTRTAGDEELYDLDADPYEQHNLAADPAQKDRVAEMRRASLDWWKATGGGELVNLKKPADAAKTK